MKAIVKTKREPGYDVLDVPRPVCGDDDVIIRVKAAGICGSDLRFISWDDPDKRKNFPVPCVLGHEFAGVVEEVGKNVTRFKVGERVVSDNTGYVCGECYHCLTADYLSCPSRQGIGYYQDGGFAQFVRIQGDVLQKDPACMWHVPEGVSLEAASMMDPACNGFRAVVQEAQVQPGDAVAVFGIGAIGLCTIQAAKVAGAARIFAFCGGPVDPDNVRVQAALRMGAEEVVSTSEVDPVAYLREKTGGEGVASVLEASGKNECIQYGIGGVRNGGKVILFGYDKRAFDISLDCLIDRGVSLVGHFAYDYKCWRSVFELLKAGKYDLDSLVTHKLPMSRFQEGVDLLHARHAIKVVVDPAE